jgi:hypothetical protein
MRIELRETAYIGLAAPAAPAPPANMYLLGLFLILNVLDVVLTHLNVSMGFALEANPLLLVAIDRFGWTGLYWFKVIGPLVLTATILQRPGSHLMASRWFSYFLALICLVSLTGVCSGIWVSTTTWMN